MSRISLIILTAALASPGSADAQFVPVRSPGAIMPGQLPMDSLGVIARHQGFAGRFPGAPLYYPHPAPFAAFNYGYPGYGYSGFGYGYPAYGYGYPGYGYPGYGYGYQPQPTVITIRRESGVTPAAEERPLRRLSGYSPPAESVDPERATLVLNVPEGAEVWFDGQQMTGQTGTERTFTTPALKPGQTYAYRVRVTWGETSRWEREVTFQAGERKSLLVTGE